MAVAGRRNRTALIALAMTVALLIGMPSTVGAAPPPPGSLDPTFGGGVVLGPVGLDTDFEEVAVQPDGKAVAVGSIISGADKFVTVSRYRTDGTPDPSFGGGDGRAEIDFEPGNTIDYAYDIAVAPDGKILVVGGYGRVTVARLRTDGTLDPAFGVGGIMTSGFSPTGGVAAGAHEIAVRPDGRVVIAARPFGFDGAIIAIQLKADGFLDPTFGTGGLAVAFVPGKQLYPIGLVLDRTGRAVIATDEGNFPTGENGTFLARFTVDGHLDTTFGYGGIGVAPLQQPTGLAMTPDGGFVLSGVGSQYPMQVARLTPAGLPDVGFGFLSIGAVAIPDAGLDGGGWGVAVRPDGKIIAAGHSGSGAIVIARFLPTGAIDPTFGANGLSVTPIGQIYSGAQGVALDPDGDIVVAGIQIFWPGGYERSMIARFTGN